MMVRLAHGFRVIGFPMTYQLLRLGLLSLESVPFQEKISTDYEMTRTLLSVKSSFKTYLDRIQRPARNPLPLGFLRHAHDWNPQQRRRIRDKQTVP